MVTIFQRSRLRSSRRRKGERGSSLLEFAIIAPVLITMFLGLVDLGALLNDYMVLSQVAGEGVRSAGGRVGLEDGPGFKNLTDPNDCHRSSPCPGQYSVQYKINSILHMQDLRMHDMAIISAYDQTPGVGGHTVSVTISGKYQGILPIFSNLRISAHKSGPYLF
jgi:hypothetical protein